MAHLKAFRVYSRNISVYFSIFRAEFLNKRNMSAYGYLEIAEKCLEHLSPSIFIFFMKFSQAHWAAWLKVLF